MEVFRTENIEGTKRQWCKTDRYHLYCNNKIKPRPFVCGNDEYLWTLEEIIKHVEPKAFPDQYYAVKVECILPFTITNPL